MKRYTRCVYRRPGPHNTLRHRSLFSCRLCSQVQLIFLGTSRPPTACAPAPDTTLLDETHDHKKSCTTSMQCALPPVPGRTKKSVMAFAPHVSHLPATERCEQPNYRLPLCSLISPERFLSCRAQCVLHGCSTPRIAALTPPPCQESHIAVLLEQHVRVTSTVVAQKERRNIDTHRSKEYRAEKVRCTVMGKRTGWGGERACFHSF